MEEFGREKPTELVHADSGVLCPFGLVAGANPEVAGGCKFPGSPAHSSVEFSDETLGPATIATYSCERGFELLGPSRRVCENGAWLPEGIPFCGKLPFSQSVVMKTRAQTVIDHYEECRSNVATARLKSKRSGNDRFVSKQVECN